MNHELIFLGGLGLLLLAFVSVVGAWSNNRKPFVGLILGATGAALLAMIHFDRAAGLYALDEVPEIVMRAVASLIAMF
ncbi:MAG: hypothetical protein JJU09_08020 [Rhodobacteraceae bacterium]|nr:hypothetical protein [Paracoccaceae bacterium]TVR45937.1 MAG: hypothetical protein EA386_11250 [Paracoccaceae bacterium]